MPRKKKPSTALVPTGGPKFYPIGGAVIEPTQLILAGRRHPQGDGPWKREADKISWMDETTGLACTILRQADGTLSGYVGLSLSTRCSALPPMPCLRLWGSPCMAG